MTIYTSLITIYTIITLISISTIMKESIIVSGFLKIQLKNINMKISTMTFGAQSPQQDLRYIKYKARPEFQDFDMKNDKGNYGTRRRTRPWDKCWFSNKPGLINITVEEACKLNPSYMKWVYINLNIKWSVYSIQIFEKL